MRYTYALATVFAVYVAAVAGRSAAGPKPEQMELSLEEKTVVREERQGSVSVAGVAIDERTADLTFVLAVKKSEAWDAVKQRTLTIRTPVNGEMIERSPESLTDDELKQLKRACHDGLKCVAVDQLLVLNKVKTFTDDGKTAVRMAITKITKVITEFTAEYHEDSYEYTEVSENDDPAKVISSVTTIVEDNRELCKVDMPPPPQQQQQPEPHSDRTERKVEDSGKSDNNGPTAVYNIRVNNGTINEAQVNVVPPAQSANDATDDRSTPTDDDGNPIVIIRIGGDDEDEDQVQDQDRKDSPAPADNGRRVARSAPSNRARPVETFKTVVRPSSAIPTATGPSSATGSSTAAAPSYSVKLDNGYGNEGSDTDVDVATAGPLNNNRVNKGLVEDGTLNNGQMTAYNYNKGIVNKGVVNRTQGGDRGQIVIGPVYNGPANNGTSNAYYNNGTQTTMSNSDVEKLVSSIDKMYSTILQNLTKK